ncbi:hypothetical protein [Alteromonas sp. C1M14]|uniref:hypothetical protein n=1 Tax=Alteromonas sp. C1M14 TaxID=2841567 RepID=UPI001C083D46|nr:hypothetical protein [Alteromonas sp. C1M14]MBU2979209.1 hypothetical protein [Alteromonas sp. C1M14]
MNTFFCLLLVLTVSFSSFSYGETSSADSCAEKDISVRGNGKRKQVTFPSVVGVQPNEALVSSCLIFTGIDTYLTLESKGVEVSINEQPFVVADGQKIKEGDSLRLRAVAPSKQRKGQRVIVNLLEDAAAVQLKRMKYLMIWRIYTSAPPSDKIYKVGPNSPYREVEDVLPLLHPGDTILLEAGASYQGFIAKNISGTKAAPITLKSDAKNPQDRPRLIGKGGGRRDWVVGLSGSYFWHIENLIVENGDVCVRHEAAYTVISDVLIRNCHHGVLGTDQNSGSLTIKNSEVVSSGGKVKGRAWGHALYIATDRDRFPDSVFTLENSFVHGNRGNAIKSRAKTTRIHDNWLETSTDEQSRYLIELIGYDAYDDSEPLYGYVENNVLVHIGNQHSIRVGGDGTGRNRGPVSFKGNLFVFSKDFSGTIFRIYHGLGSLDVVDSVFLIANASPILIRDMLTPEQWTFGKPRVRFEGNKVGKVATPYYHDKGNADLSEAYFSDVILNNDIIDFVSVDLSDHQWLEQLATKNSVKNFQLNVPFTHRPTEQSYIMKNN